MPFYKAEAYKPNGRKIEVREEAISEAELIKKLLAQGYSVTSIREDRSSVQGKNIAGILNIFRSEASRKSGKHKLSLEDQHLFCITVSSYLNSGVSLTDVLRLLQKQTRNKNIKPVYTELREYVESGRSLAASMRLLGAFRESLIGMTESGEKSASLPEILERAAELIENEITLRRKLRSSLTYPLLMLTVGIGVTIFLLTFVVPRLTALVIDSGAELPLITRALIWFSNFIKCALPFIAAGVPLAVYIIRKKGLNLSFLAFKGIKENIAFAMIFSQTGTLLKSGISLTEALKLTEPLDPINGRLALVADNIRKGHRFSYSLEKEGSFPEEIVSVIRVGENGQNLADGLIRLGSNCWDTAQASMQRYAALAEPIIILGMGFIVGFVVIAVLLPIFDLSVLAMN